MSDYKIDTLEVESQIIAPAATTSVAGLQSPTDKTKLDSVQSGATANSTDAQLRDRATHTGTQLSTTISDFSTAASTASPVQSVAGQTGTVVLTKSDVGLANVDNTSDATKNAAVAILTNKTLTTPVINSPTGLVKADVGLNLVDNTSDLSKPISTATQTALNLKYDATNPSGYQTAAQVTSTVSVASTADRDRANHTGTQVSSTISDFSEAVDDRVAALVVAGAGITSTYNDVANTLTVASTITQYTDEQAQDAVGTILTDSSSVDFTYNDVANTITAAVLPAGVNHNALQNYVANEHVNHSTVSITAGTGLSGGGDITATRTLAIANTMVTAGSYGNDTNVPTFTVNAQGQITASSNTAITFPVTSIFGRSGIVTAQAGDYTAAQVGADPTGTAASAIAAHIAAADPHTQYLTTTEGNAAYAPIAHVGSGGVAHSVATQTVAGFMSTGDKTKLDGLPSVVPVSSVFTRTGAVVAQSGDYTATQVTNTPAGNIAATTVQAALNELDTEKAKLAGGNTFTGSQRIEGGFTVKQAANTALVLAADGGGGNSVSFEFKPFEARTGGSSSRIVGLDNNFSSDIIFYNAQTGDGANVAIERMRLGADGQLSVGTGTPSASAKMEISSTTQGFLPPRMTTAQRLAIASPAEGLFVFDTDFNTLCEYSGTSWKYEVRVNTTAIQTSTSTTYANITEFTTLGLEVGLYVLELKGIMQSTATTTGLGLRLAAGTATISSVVLNWTFSQAGAGTDKNYEYSQLTTADNVTSTGVLTANTNLPVFGNGVFRLSVAGTVAIQLRTEVNASGISIRPDSTIMLKKIG